MANGNTIGRLTYQPYPQGDSNSHIMRIAPSNKRKLTPAEQESLRADWEKELQTRLANGPTVWSIAGDIAQQYGHEVLDAAGAIPVVGPAFDAANGSWYAAEGNAFESTASFASAAAGIASGGLGSGLYKAASRGVKYAAKGLRSATKGIKAASRETKLGKTLKTSKGSKGSKGRDGGGDTGKNKPSDPCKTGNGIGRPVNPILGIKGLYDKDDLDFSLPAVVPLIWQRCYFSDVDNLGFMGQGWLLPIDVQIRQENDFLVYYDEQGRRIFFPLLIDDDDTFFNRYDSLEIKKKSEKQFSIKDIFSGHISTFSQSDDFSKFLLIAIEDRFGNKLSIAREADGSASEIIDSSGRCFIINYTEIGIRGGDALKRIEGVKCRFSSFNDKNETLVSYKYDPYGNLCSVLDGSGTNVRQFMYNNNILIKHILFGGYECSYQYDKLSRDGKVIKHTTNRGEIWYFHYGKNQTKVIDGSGNEVIYKYDDDYNLLEYIDANGNKTQHQYDILNREIEFIDADNNKTRYLYDFKGNIILTVFPDGGTERVYFDPQLNLPIAVVSPCGGRFDYKYDLNAGECKIFKPSGKFTTYLFDKRGRLISNTDFLGNEKKYTYDFLGNLCSSEDCSGNIAEYKTDKFGFISEVKSSEGHCSRYVNDQTGRTRRITHPDLTEEKFDYNHSGQLIKYINRSNNATCFTYDNFGLISSLKHANGDEYKFIYDTYGHLSSIKNPGGQKHLFAWDANNNLTSETAFDGIRRDYKYYASGREQEIIEYGVSKTEDPADVLHTHFSYNKLGRVTCVDSWFESSSERCFRKYEYDSVGRLIEASTHDNINTSFSYDPDGLLSQETTKVLSKKFSLNYDYDANENIIALHCPNGNSLRNQYYGSGHLLATSYGNMPICEFGRDSLHRETSRTQGEITSRFEYDSMNRILNYSTTKNIFNKEKPHLQTIISLRYQWGKNGTLDAIYDNISSLTKTTRFSYDLLDRLTRSNNKHFNFDNVGNVFGDSLLNRPPPPSDSEIIRYDNFGNVILKKTDKTYEFRWNSFNQLIQSSSDFQTNKTITQYGYDALGRRIFKKNNDDVTFFTWDRERLLNENTNNSIFTYIYGDDFFKPIARVEQNACSDDPAKPKICWFHTDPVGLPMLLTDEHGAVIWRGKYTSWGKLIGSHINNDRDDGISGLHQPLRYPGQYADDETNLSYNRYRYYDPEMGQFISQDPVRLAGGLNFYQYVTNPLTNYDPLGLIGVNVTPGAGGSFDLTLQRNVYPETAGHIDNAIRQGHPSSVTIDRQGAKSNRAKSLAPVRRDIRAGRCPKPAKGQDLDEWPMAMFKEGGSGASVRAISAGDNRGAGSSIAHGLRGLPDGTVVNFRVV
ncbi:RHS repeat-associated core domain-containing protein [Pantoea agglomerans]|uniref:RHS repeat-associated core domain-containing protein n=1 Tax=Enterobacter agglomerans TaxID=549 RepID=UPI00301CF449